MDYFCRYIRVGEDFKMLTFTNYGGRNIDQGYDKNATETMSNHFIKKWIEYRKDSRHYSDYYGREYKFSYDVLNKIEEGVKRHKLEFYTKENDEIISTFD